MTGPGLAACDPGAGCRRRLGTTLSGVAGTVSRSHHRRVSQPQPEREEAYEAWRDLQDVLEERDREWWAGAEEFEDDD